MADLENIKKEVESYQNQSVFNRLSSKQFNQIVESMNLYLNRLSEKEAELDRRQAELNEKQDKLNKEVSNFNQEKKEVAESKRQALETIRIFKEKEPTLRDTSIPDEAITRDKIIINELDDIKEQVKILKEREQSIIDNTDYTVELTDKEKNDRIKRTDERRKQKNILKARLLGIVAAYRDLLPEDQLNFLTIKNKSFSAFLKDEIEKIELETSYGEKNWENDYYNSNRGKIYNNINKISKDFYASIANGYRSIVGNKDLSVVIRSVNGRSYSPFSYEDDSYDVGSLGFGIVNSIFDGREKSFNIIGTDSSLTRTVENMSDKPLVEKNIIDTDDEFDYSFYDVEEPKKTL